jgi:hypothetical protein
MIKPKHLIDLATTPGSQRDYIGHLRTLCDTLGVDHATYCSVNPFSGVVHGFTTYPDEWKVHYVTNGMQSIDPTLQAARRSVAPVDWRRLRSEQFSQRVFTDAKDFDLPDQGVKAFPVFVASPIPCQAYGLLGTLVMHCDSM